MQPLPSSVGIEDVDQWVRGCVVAVVAKDGPSPWYGTAMGVVAGSKVILSPLTQHGREEAYVEVPRSAVRLVWPMCGSVNLPEDRVAVHLQRVALRQWKRSLTLTCLDPRVPREWETFRHSDDIRLLVRSGRADLPVVRRALWACVYPEYYSPNEARNMVLSESWKSVAINPNIILVGDCSGKLIYYYRGWPAAYSSGYGTLTPVTDGRYLARIRRQLKGELS